MKLSIVFFATLLGLDVCLAQTTSNDPADYLSAEMKMTGEEGGSEPALRKLRLLPAEQRFVVVDAIIRKLQSISAGPAPAPPKTVIYVCVAAGILYEIGTDEQIIQAFGALSNFGHAEPDAAEVLVSCKGSGGVEIIQKLAEKRLPELESAINPKNEEEKAQSNDIVIPFYSLVLSLDGARNPKGPRAAKMLRDQVAARYVSENGKILVAALDEGMAKARRGNKKERTNPEPLRPEKHSNPAKLQKSTGQSNREPTQPRQRTVVSLAVSSIRRGTACPRANSAGKYQSC